MACKNSSEIAFLGYGQGVAKAWQVLRALQEMNNNANLIDLIFAKPLDEELLCELAKKVKFGLFLVKMLKLAV